MQSATNCVDRVSLKQALASELALRSCHFDRAQAQIILRYGSFVGSEIDCYPRLPRAMDKARESIVATENNGLSIASGLVIMADTMIGSKGRFNRVWHAPVGGLWGCLVQADTLLDTSRQLLPLAVGAACCEAVHEVGGDAARLRWVNDVLFGHKKVAGFLIEAFTSPHYQENYSLIGFGINVNNDGFPPELTSLATSLNRELGRDIDLGRFAGLFLAKLAWNIGLIHFEEQRLLHGEPPLTEDGSHLLIESWRNLSDTIGRRVLYGFDVMIKPQYRAEVIALAEDGGLKMRLEDGSVITEHSGEIRYLT